VDLGEESLGGEFQRLKNHVKSGHISAPLTALVSCYGGQPAEAVLRGMYYSGRLERRFDYRFRLAVAMENQTQPLGLASLWAGGLRRAEAPPQASNMGATKSSSKEGWDGTEEGGTTETE